MKPKKDHTSLTLVGVGQLAFPLSLTGSMASCPDLTIMPRYSTFEEANWHFSSFRWRSNSFICCST